MVAGLVSMVVIAGLYSVVVITGLFSVVVITGIFTGDSELTSIDIATDDSVTVTVVCLVVILFP